MGLGDRDYTSTLLRDQPTFWVRREARDRLGIINLEFEGPSNHHEVYIEIKNENGREILQKFEPQKSASFSRIFACGYGAARSVFATNTYDRYRTLDSVYSLFDYTTPLQNPELMWRRLETDGGYSRSSLTELFDDILILPRGSTQIDKYGIKISGPWGTAMPIGTLGDGYQSIINVVSDYIGWGMFYYESTKSFEEMAGIILIDEIEQHLHPIWQRNIVKRLADRFPKTQFICTTHSPLVAAGTANLDHDNYRLWQLSAVEGQTYISGNRYQSLQGLRADQILTSKAFGLPDSRDTRAEEMLTEYRELLLTQNPTKLELYRLEELREKLESYLPGSSEMEEDRVLNRRLMKHIIENELKPLSKK